MIARRLEAAREEMRHCGEFDYVIMNQDFARAVDDLSAIVRAARLTAPRQARAARGSDASRCSNPESLRGLPMARITIEDCLDKIPNRFELTLAATNRARQISAGLGAARRDRTATSRPSIALREIAAGKVGIEMLLKAQSLTHAARTLMRAAMRHVGNRGVHPTPRQLPAAA